MTKNNKRANIKPTPARPVIKAPRAASKPAQILQMLEREQGASLDDLTQRTTWKPHSVRAALTGLRKRGYKIQRAVLNDTSYWYVSEGAAQ